MIHNPKNHQTRKNSIKSGRNSLDFVISLNHRESTNQAKGANPFIAYSITGTYKMKQELLNFSKNYFKGGIQHGNIKTGLGAISTQDAGMAGK